MYYLVLVYYIKKFDNTTAVFVRFLQLYNFALLNKKKLIQLMCLIKVFKGKKRFYIQNEEFIIKRVIIDFKINKLT